MMNITSNTPLFVGAVAVTLILAAFVLIMLGVLLRAIFQRWLPASHLRYRGTRRRGTPHRS